MTNDGINEYAYDAEGRICAVYSGATEEFTGYIYDGLGNRISKGTLDPAGGPGLAFETWE